ncbi:MAG: HupE/UreJ family protein [Gemmatimonadetes bacterium]|nr:HupE/UreJ family protein [Gemmatimonadota bacterium]
MNELGLYLKVGFHHIADWRATDHILFVAALTAAYGPREWARLAWLVTAFTIGHSVTLALTTMDLLRISTRVVEPLIALTIVVTAFAAIHDQRAAAQAAGGGDGSISRAAMARRYAIAAGFGLIHGCGFASGLRSLLGGSEGIAIPLLGFNLGLEVGQLLVVSAIFLLGLGVERMLGWSRRDWVLVVSGAAAGVGLSLLVERVFGGGGA